MGGGTETSWPCPACCPAIKSPKLWARGWRPRCRQSAACLPAAQSSELVVLFSKLNRGEKCCEDGRRGCSEPPRVTSRGDRSDVHSWEGAGKKRLLVQTAALAATAVLSKERKKGKKSALCSTELQLPETQRRQHGSRRKTRAAKPQTRQHSVSPARNTAPNLPSAQQRCASSHFLLLAFIPSLFLAACELRPTAALPNHIPEDHRGAQCGS